MAKINFPNNRDQLNPPLPTGALQDGDTTNITADGVTITYVYKKPGAPNTDSWWKSMGRVNNATPIDKIEEGNSSVEVIDTGSNGQVVVTTDGTARAKFRTDGSFVVGGSNLDTDPNITLEGSDGSAQFAQTINVGGRPWAGEQGGGISPAGEVQGTNGANNGVWIGRQTGSTDITSLINGSGSAVFAGPVSSYRFSGGGGAIYFPGDPAIFGPTNSNYIYNGSNDGDDGTYFANTPFTSNADLTALMANDGSFRLGGNLPLSPKISLNADGTGEFAGNVQIGDEPRGGANNGIYMSASAGEINLTNVSTGNVLSVRANGSSTQTAFITAAGEGNFAMGVQIGGDYLNDDPNISLNADGSGYFQSALTCAASADNAGGASQIWYANDGTTQTMRWGGDKVLRIGGDVGSNPNITINGRDGSAKFAGKITLTGTVDGIQFGSTNSGGNVTSQTLDDYEEGTWTPSINTNNNDAVLTYGFTFGHYIKVGGLVTVFFWLTARATDVGTGTQVLLNGLPLAGSNNAIYRMGTPGFGRSQNFNSVIPDGMDYIEANPNSMVINAQGVNITPSNLNTGADMILNGQFSYIAT